MKKNNSSVGQELLNINNIIRNKYLIYGDFKKFFLYFAIFIGLILINYLFSIKTDGGQEFFVNWASARLLFLQGLNPYSQEAIKHVSDLAKELLIHFNGDNSQFISPLYSLFIYLPFGLIQNFILSKALWMTFNELIAILSGYLIIRILQWKPERKERFFLYSFSFLFFYAILNLINGNNLILLNFIFLFGLKLILDEKYMRAGIIFAFLTINIQTFMIPLIIVLVYAINKKGWNFALWFLITILLLGLVASLLITDWPVLLLREILRNPLSADFSFPGTIILQWSKKTIPWLWNGMALIALGILFYELLFFENDKDSFLWKVSLALVLNPLIWMQANLDIMITLLLPFELIFFQWLARDKRIGTFLMISISTLFSFGLLGLGILTQSIIFKNPYSFFFYLFPIIILLINLYWMRWWMKAKEVINY